ncbi:MAG: alpha/beta fold hydrolase, partial [Pseudomonadota bacterium]
CSPKLKNEGNAPYVLQSMDSKGVVVLFHGLSDSPFFIRSIAEHLHRLQFTVVVPLTPGHGKLDADADMQDSALKERWYQHVNEVMQTITPSDNSVIVGGFSTGAAFATWYSIQHPESVTALLTFSGALELSSNAESMSRIWGIKTLAKWLDGQYETEGPNPYKYPKVASYAGLVLMDIIYDIREILETKDVSLPVFAAHSIADTTTLFSGIEWLTRSLNGEHTIFKIDESYALCHADLPLSQYQINTMNFKKSMVDVREECAVPQANPLHEQMLNTLSFFLEQHVQSPSMSL